MVWYCVEKGVIFHEARLSIVLYPCHPAITGGACAKAPQQRERPRGSGCHGEEPLHFNVHTSNLEKCIKSYFNRSSPKMHHIASREASRFFREALPLVPCRGSAIRIRGLENRGVDPHCLFILVQRYRSLPIGCVLPILSRRKGELWPITVVILAPAKNSTTLVIL